GTAVAAEPPVLDTAVHDNTVTLRVIDPHSGAANALTTCYPVLVDIRDAIPLAPVIAGGQTPTLEQLRPALYWGPAIPGTAAGARDRGRSPGSHLGDRRCAERLLSGGGRVRESALGGFGSGAVTGAGGFVAAVGVGGGRSGQRRTAHPRHGGGRAGHARRR